MDAFNSAGEGDSANCALPATLRALTYLSPGIPFEFFEALTEELGRALGCDVWLAAEERSSGPVHGDLDPFGAGEMDLGFLCSPSYLYLASRSTPSVELVPAACAFGDRRSAGQPVYYSEVVVRHDHPAASFADLQGAVWGYNDTASLSGHFSTLQHLAELGRGEEFFQARLRTGSHLESLEAIRRREIDAAAIDSVVLARVQRERPDLAADLRVVESWGPFPIQPVVLRRGTAPDLAARVAQAWLEVDLDGEHAAIFERCAFLGFRPVDPSFYAEEGRVLRSLGHFLDPPEPNELP